MLAKARQIALLAVPIILIGLYSGHIPLNIGDWLLVPCAALVAWKSGKPTNSWVVAQILIGLSIGFAAVKSALDGMTIVTLWVYSLSELAEGIRLIQIIRKGTWERKYFGGWFKDYNWPDGPGKDNNK